MCKSIYDCLRVVMIVFNFLFVVIGLALVAVSFYFYFGSFAKSADKDVNLLAISLFSLMAIGGLTVIIGICGCCGAYHGSKCLLGTYFALLLIIFLAEIGGGVVGFLKQDEMKKYTDEFLDTAVHSKKKNDPSDEKIEFIDVLQNIYTCCGKKGFTDYIGLNLETGVNRIPKSCCSTDDCRKNVKTQLTTMFTAEGCSQKIKDTYLILFGVIIGIAIIELLGLIIAMSMCCTLSRSTEYNSVPAYA